MRLSLIDDQKSPNEKWIERKVIKGKIIEYKFGEFDKFQLINAGNSSNVYKARFKDTGNICALKVIEKNNHTNKEIINEITNGLREKPIANTNPEYVAIYQRCWQGMQDDRPSIEEVATALEDIIDQDITVDDSSDIFFDNSGFEEFISNTFKNINENIKLNATAVGQDEMTLFVNDLYSTFRKLFNESESVNDIIINFISKSGKTNEEVFNWLLENNNYSKYICLRGLFHLWNIGTDEKNEVIFNLFNEAANKGDAIAQYFVGKCYAEGWNTSRNRRKAIEYYTKAAENECTAADRVLGEYNYKLKKYTKAFKYLKKAVDNGNLKALNTLGLCYQKGQGTDTDMVKGFKLFRKAAGKFK
ncbi:9918_t:CDS:2 [Gigaspora rosea]|nr:9918_t:CDS:2 [Gigaspora rosea]